MKSQKSYLFIPKLLITTVAVYISLPAQATKNPYNQDSNNIKNSSKYAVISPHTTMNKDTQLNERTQEAVDTILPLSTHSQLLSLHKKFTQISPQAFIHFKTNFARNDYKIPYDDRIYLSNVINLYESLSELFQAALPSHQFLDSTTPSTLQKLYDDCNELIHSHGITKIEQIQEVITAFSFSINIDQMLFAYPISLVNKIEQSQVNIESIANVIPKRTKKIDSYSYSDSNSYSDSDSNQDTISNNDFIQKFAVYNANADSLFEAYIIVKAEDYEKIENRKQWSLKDILSTRFNNLSHSRQFVDAYWVYENQAGELFSAKINIDKHNPASAHTINHYHIDNRLSGVFYGGEKTNSLIRYYHSLFTFETSLPVIKSPTATQLCINNEANQSILVNQRTKKSSKAGYQTRNCIDVRIGDLVSLHQYIFFPSSEPTATYIVLNPLNKMNHFIKSNIHPAYLGVDLSLIKK